MISFFRKIRQKLVQDLPTGKVGNRVTRYLTYAVGEIILVMAGILIALQVNNWNEERKRQEEFAVTIEQIYNVLDVEIQELLFLEYHFMQQNLYIDTLYNRPELLAPSHIPGILNYEEAEPSPFQTSTGFFLQNLKVKPGNPDEILLARDLTEYASMANLEFNRSEKLLKELLLKETIPTPDLTFGIALNQRFLEMPGVFTEDQILRSQEMINDPEVRAALIKAAVLHDSYTADAFHVRELGETLKTQIKRQFPHVKLLYKNLGLVGEGSPHQDWGTDVPFERKSEDPNIWEAEIELPGGQIKFRENQTWNRNWGGNTFPKGYMYWQGPNLEVPAGKYRIVLNMTDKTYEFIPLTP
ncbi:hypothetical protein E4S40_15390 [Algoriphagus kandeliae]|uniref:Uncharacterized protein n=1 Tax=Algoriphagus kandeliae TaxID=2562278 RepID=A0A4Y9QRT4_9BACT|nr:DUF6090 family protein [Algoriphagus kandeliae]TFV93625.1 hypothetical protein E4S40_15390 [Algoriphagus kandeliae]